MRHMVWRYGPPWLREPLGSGSPRHEPRIRISRRRRSAEPGTMRARAGRDTSIPEMAKPGLCPNSAQSGVRHPVFIRSFRSNSPLPSGLATTLATLPDTTTGQVLVSDGALPPVPAHDFSDDSPRLPNPGASPFAVTSASYLLWQTIAIGVPQCNLAKIGYFRTSVRIPDCFATKQSGTGMMQCA